MLNLKYFIISLSIGLLYTYLNDEKEIIYIHPNPDNYESLQFKDKSNSCFSYNIQETKCNSEYKNIQHQR
jgi:hypothetical protein